MTVKNETTNDDDLTLAYRRGSNRHNVQKRWQLIKGSKDES
jgi:hypothetical protein